MDPISRTPRTDLHVEATAPRPTPRSGVNFREMLARSASSLVQGAQTAVTQMPGGAVLAAAVRGASSPAGGSAGVRGGLPASPASLAAPAPQGAPAAPGGAGSGNPLAPPPAAGAPPAGADGTTAPAEGPGATGASPEGGGGSVENMLQSSADMNLYYLQLQEAMSTENRVYSAQSNVLKARHDTVKNAIGNIR
jgi:hypothetical protein